MQNWGEDPGTAAFQRIPCGMNESAPQPQAAVGAERGWQTPVPVTDGAWGSSEHSREWVGLSWALGERGEKKKMTRMQQKMCVRKEDGAKVGGGGREEVVLLVWEWGLANWATDSRDWAYWECWPRARESGHTEILLLTPERNMEFHLCCLLATCSLQLPSPGNAAAAPAWAGNKSKKVLHFHFPWIRSGKGRKLLLNKLSSWPCFSGNRPAPELNEGAKETYGCWVQLPTHSSGAVEGWRG